eukprot:3307838-Rhodomonas_salina.1
MPSTDTQLLRATWYSQLSETEGDRAICEQSRGTVSASGNRTARLCSCGTPSTHLQHMRYYCGMCGTERAYGADPHFIGNSVIGMIPRLPPYAFVALCQCVCCYALATRSPVLLCATCGRKAGTDMASHVAIKAEHGMGSTALGDQRA